MKKTITSIFIFLLKSVFVVLLISYFANVLSDNYAKKITNEENKYTQDLRQSYQGLWLIKIKINTSEYNPYKGLITFYQGNIFIDNNLSINGDMYMLKDITDNKENYYERGSRRHSEIRGSIINDHAQLSLYSDYENKKSLEFLDGHLSKNTIKGDFVSEVANSKGNFCMVKINTINMSDNINCSLE